METDFDCKCTIVHSDIIQDVSNKLPSFEKLADLAEIFKTLGDTTRIRIVYSLMLSEMCVCDLSALLRMSHSAISHQLKVLRSSRLVKTRKEGKVVYYSLDDEHIKDIVNTGMIHINE